MALIEAKAENLPPTHGLEQGKGYAACKRLNVSFVFSSNGHLFVEFDRKSGKTSSPKPLTQFPTPAELRARYEGVVGFNLEDPAARPLLARYSGGEATRRYYQDAAIRATFEKIAQCEKTGQPKRALLSLATGSGKTFIAVQLLKRIGDAGNLKRALFVCDRDELRLQGLTAFQNVFGSDAASAFQKPDGTNNAKNARIHIATYQTLDVDTDEAAANFLAKHYPPDHFSHVIIDECHRSAWGKWSEVLKRNPNAVQVGLTATPRQLKIAEKSKEALADAAVTADNLKHFGEPVYEYEMGQGIEDGYLAACEIECYDLFHDNKHANERETGVSRDDLKDKHLTDANTGQPVTRDQARDKYDAASIEDKLLMPERVAAMTKNLFERLLATGGPEQKTIIFCARDRHADTVAIALNNLYTDHCTKNGKPRLEAYAFKCTAESGGSEYIADLKDGARHHFIATTVDLLTTGVDVPSIRNVVFFKYVRSPISFYQMIGRGTRLHPPSGKLMFRVFDYTNATRLFGEKFITKPPTSGGGGGGGEPTEPTLQVEGFDVHINEAGRYIVAQVNGKAMPITVEEYKERLAEKLVKEVPTLEAFRSTWIIPPKRQELLGKLPEAGRSVRLVRELEEMQAYDLFDVLAELGYGLAPKNRVERAAAFSYKHAQWLSGMPAPAATTLKALAGQFARSGTDGLENPKVFDTPEIVKAGGLAALKAMGRPSDILLQTKERMFAA